MSDCRKCADFEWCKEYEECGLFKQKQITNADRIRSMTDEELANMWFSYVDCGECPMHRECNMLPQDCLRLALEWLKEEAVDNGACSANETSEKVQNE